MLRRLLTTRSGYCSIGVLAYTELIRRSGPAVAVGVATCKFIQSIPTDLAHYLMLLTNYETYLMKHFSKKSGYGSTFIHIIP